MFFRNEVNDHQEEAHQNYPKMGAEWIFWGDNQDEYGWNEGN
jgi:hypothetical protein